ncbi:D-alanyl-D-alanine carboxypeptidase [Lachnospiraceae bacterium]|nr:D-alanyl-D-alanine carboxypeptidase [Lachnospiraceae bacterium]
MKNLVKGMLFAIFCACSVILIKADAYAMVTDISGYPAGTVLNASEIDMANLRQYFTSSPINAGDSVYNRIYGKSYVDNSNIALSDLRYLKMLHYNFDGNVQVGEMIVNKSISASTLAVFTSLFTQKYGIRQMHLVDDFWNVNSSVTDDVCMLVDNTSCFNYRVVQGSSKISKHALGLAIDINPHENPYAKVMPNGTLSMFHPELYAEGYLTDRSGKAHAITSTDTAYQVFTANGFAWGGSWKTVKDFQHFER